MLKLFSVNLVNLNYNGLIADDLKFVVFHDGRGSHLTCNSNILNVQFLSSNPFSPICFGWLIIWWSSRSWAVLGSQARQLACTRGTGDGWIEEMHFREPGGKGQGSDSNRSRMRFHMI